VTMAFYGNIDYLETATPARSHAGVINGCGATTNGQLAPANVGRRPYTHQTVLDRIYDS
jgi:hypothetical protein